MFPATDPADVQALTACIDWVLERMLMSATETAPPRAPRVLVAEKIGDSGVELLRSTSTSTSASAGAARSWPSGSATTTAS